MKKKTSTALFTAQLLTGLVAAAAAYSLKPRPAAKRNQVVVITGASRGLGLALAERYGRAGAKLVLASRNLDELLHARNLLVERNAVQSPDDVLVIPADLTDHTQAINLIDHAIDHFGRIDVLINNAGIIEVGPVQNQPLEAYRRAMDTNFFAALHTIHAALPHLLRRDRSAGDASIVNIASIGGKFSMPHLLPYNASKFALVGLSEGLHAELRHKGIRVTTVCPGLMRTGGETHANYVGQIEKERRWFQLAARTPILAASVKHAADRIFHAVAEGRAKITITPQAWLAARLVGLAPNATQYLASLANHLILPSPVPTNQLTLRFNLSSINLYRNSSEEEISNPS
jgi:NAD(P)-dependent dehydrogenase (short-subunit alcohol dehydrogenase family)